MTTWLVSGEIAVVNAVPFVDYSTVLVMWPASPISAPVRAIIYFLGHPFSPPPSYLILRSAVDVEDVGL